MDPYKAVKDALDACKNPLFFFHDDTDGLCSFLELWRYKKEGHWAIVKARPKIDEQFLRKVEEYDPDAIFVLDVAEIDQEFIDKAKRPIVWIDHHEPLDRDAVVYCNPHLFSPQQNIPTTLLCYNILKDEPVAEEIMWIAMVGSIADWHMPEWKDTFCSQYPTLLDKNMTRPEVALFDQPLGKIARMLNFLTKGVMKDVKKSILALLKIKGPLELLDATTAPAVFLMRRYGVLAKEYDALWKEVQKAKTKDMLLLFTYTEDKTSFTGEVATEAVYRYPEKIVLVCREKSGEMRCSLRSATKPILPLLKKALVGIDGYGGGHDYACGTGIKKDDFARFVENLREQLK